MLAFALVVGTGVFRGDRAYRTGEFSDSRHWGEYWSSRNVDIAANARTEVAFLLGVDERFPQQQGTLIVMLADDRVRTYTQTMFLTSIQRNSGETAELLYARDGLIWRGNDEQALIGMFTRAGTHIHVVATSGAAAKKVESIQGKHPELPITLATMPYPPPAAG